VMHVEGVSPHGVVTFRATRGISYRSERLVFHRWRFWTLHTK
jgi:hypothetical protein